MTPFLSTVLKLRFGYTHRLLETPMGQPRMLSYSVALRNSRSSRSSRKPLSVGWMIAPDEMMQALCLYVVRPDPWPGVQEDDGLGAGTESDGNSDVASSTTGPTILHGGTCAFIQNAFRKIGLEPVDASVITPEQMH